MGCRCPDMSVVDIHKATQQGQNGYGANTDGGHWRNVAIAIEPSVCACDTASCQITLTT